jgi:hypothetical protein
MTEKQIRDIVKDVLKKELKDMATKADVKKAGESLTNKQIKQVKDEIRKSMLAYNKFMWEKKGIWMNQI